MTKLAVELEHWPSWVMEVFPNERIDSRLSESLLSLKLDTVHSRSVCWIFWKYPWLSEVSDAAVIFSPQRFVADDYDVVSYGTVLGREVCPILESNISASTWLPPLWWIKRYCTVVNVAPVVVRGVFGWKVTGLSAWSETLFGTLNIALALTCSIYGWMHGYGCLDSFERVLRSCQKTVFIFQTYSHWFWFVGGCGTHCFQIITWFAFEARICIDIAPRSH